MFRTLFEAAKALMARTAPREKFGVKDTQTQRE